MKENVYLDCEENYNFTSLLGGLGRWAIAGGVWALIMGSPEFVFTIQHLKLDEFMASYWGELIADGLKDELTSWIEFKAGPTKSFVQFLPLLLLPLLRNSLRRGVESLTLLLIVALIPNVLHFLLPHSLWKWLWISRDLSELRNHLWYLNSYNVKSIQEVFFNLLLGTIGSASILGLVLYRPRVSPVKLNPSFSVQNLTGLTKAYNRHQVWRAFCTGPVFVWTVIAPIVALILYAFLLYAVSVRHGTLGEPGIWIFLGIVSLPIAAFVLTIICSYIPTQAWAIFWILLQFVCLILMLNNLRWMGYVPTYSMLIFLLLSIPSLLWMIFLMRLITVPKGTMDVVRTYQQSRKDFWGRFLQLAGAPAYQRGVGKAGKRSGAKFFWGNGLLAPERMLLLSLFLGLPTMVQVSRELLGRLGGWHGAWQNVLAYWGGVFGALLATIVVFGLMGKFGRRLLMRARRDITDRYQSAVETDNRPPVLYLRSFELDHARIASRRSGLFSYMIKSPGAPARMDEIVLDRLSVDGPVIAIGRPKEPLPPFGAARIYVGESEDWQSVVKSLVAESSTIVICLEETEGVRWEANLVSRPENRSKTLFLTSPAASREERLVQLQNVFPELAIDEETLRGKEVIGAMEIDGDLTIQVASHASREAYVCAVGLFSLAQHRGRADADLSKTRLCNPA